MTTHTWDTIVIGGGTAGLSAALMLGRSRRSTLVLDAGAPRNRFAAHMHGVLGHDGMSPSALLARGRQEVTAYGVEVRTVSVTRVEDRGTTLSVTTDTSTEHGRTVILATGITDQLPAVAGLAERWGHSVIHCPYCHGWEVRDQRLGVIVSAPAQVHLAAMVRQLSDRVTVFVQEGGLVDADERARLSARGVSVVDSAVIAVNGPGRAITSVDTADGRTFSVDAVFAGGAPVPHDGALADLALERSDALGPSLIAVAPDGATSHPRAWAAGNVVNPMATVPMAASAGAMAGARVNAFLVQEDVERALRGTPGPR